MGHPPTRTHRLTKPPAPGQRQAGGSGHEGNIPPRRQSVAFVTLAAMSDTTPSITVVETFTHGLSFETHPLADETVCYLCDVVRRYLRTRPEAGDDAVRRLRGQAASPPN